jgi:translation initiation factor IF-2
MKMGVMATVTQALDADTAQLVVEEFGHRVRRVSEADVELGLVSEPDAAEDSPPRAPVVTIMGHVDHGKTSLLDALRKTDVAAREAGGITQHIGAYQVTLEGGEKITFIDTPGHEAFTAMRARGAQVTDIVVLVVAADDGVMPQTIEAIRHAKAAKVPLIVAINKMDKPDARPDRVRNELLSHEIVVESMGGETQEVEVSALKGTGLDELTQAIVLQAEVLDLRANPNRAGEGTVVESRLDQGRGPVATVLVQRGTLNKGDIVVAGAEWGRVRALVDDKGSQLNEAGPSVPVEVLGLTGVPSAGERLQAVENEKRAREITDYRQRQAREKVAAGQAASRGTLDQMLAAIQAGAQKEVAVVVKADVQGSAEALNVLLPKQGNEEVKVRVLHGAVGQITESDIVLAKASNAVVVAFNVRATAQARELAKRDGVDIRYYSIIYEAADDVAALVKGKTAPKQRENFLGYAEIRQVFEVTKVGKVAGCRVTEGVVRRGAGVRLLRDGVVIHTGELATLKRFKDDVKEVTNGYECGMSFANYQDIREGDVIECFETELVAAA